MTTILFHTKGTVGMLRFRSPLILAGLTLIMLGCGDANRVKVQGTVTFSDDGSPLKRGVVCFDNDKAMARGTVQPDGSYVIGIGNDGRGLEPGSSKVSIFLPTRKCPAVRCMLRDTRNSSTTSMRRGIRRGSRSWSILRRRVLTSRSIVPHRTRAAAHGLGYARISRTDVLTRFAAHCRDAGARLMHAITTQTVDEFGVRRQRDAIVEAAGRAAKPARGRKGISTVSAQSRR